MEFQATPLDTRIITILTQTRKTLAHVLSRVNIQGDPP
jgi:hypothetical protein